MRKIPPPACQRLYCAGCLARRSRLLATTASPSTSGSRPSSRHAMAGCGPAGLRSGAHVVAVLQVAADFPGCTNHPPTPHPLHLACLPALPGTQLQAVVIVPGQTTGHHTSLWAHTSLACSSLYISAGIHRCGHGRQGAGRHAAEGAIPGRFCCRVLRGQAKF